MKLVGGETWSTLKWSVMISLELICTKLSIKIELSVKRFFLSNIYQVACSMFNVQRFSVMECFAIEEKWLSQSFLTLFQKSSSIIASPTNQTPTEPPANTCTAGTGIIKAIFKPTGTFKLKGSLLVHQKEIKGGVPSSGVNAHCTLAARVVVQPTFSVFFNCCSKVDHTF